MKWFLVLAVAAPLCAQTCTYSFSPDPAQVINVAAAGTVLAPIGVTAPDGCQWHYYSDSSSWISFTPAAFTTFSGNGTFSFSASANVQLSQRQAKIFVVTNNGSVTFNINQAAPVCDLTLAPVSASAAVGGGSGTFQVQTACVWSASSSGASWITLTAPTSGTGNGPVSYTVAANVCSDGRSGAIAVQSGSNTGPLAQFKISQDGSPDNLTLAPSTLSVPDTGADNGRFNIVTGNGCGWTAYSDVSWLQIAGASAGTGNGGVAYRVLANTGPLRTGNIHILGSQGGTHLFAVTQQAKPAPPVVLLAIVNGGSGAVGPVSPGEIVSLWGTNMGPAIGLRYQVSADGLSLTQTLGGVQVLFDGKPAPLLWVSAQQINTIVPYSVAGNASTKVVVQYQSGVSNVLEAPLQDATPGIFTLDGSGHGAGAIRNEDSTLNAPGNGAARGSAVMIYCTGGGVTSPASVEGGMTPGVEPFPVIQQPVSVSIGGIDAQVLYRGSAPLAIGGLNQINAVVPSGVMPGPAVPIVVHMGNWQSQSGVTLVVK